MSRELETIVSEMRAYGDRDQLPTTIVLHWADRIAALTASPQAAPEGELPPLPHPRQRFDTFSQTYRTDHYTADDMRAYARAAIASPQVQGGEADEAKTRGAAIRRLNYILWMEDKGGCEPPADWQEGYRAGMDALTTKLREILDERVEELAQRLVASGPKAAHVSASECHEITDAILDTRAALASGPSGECQHRWQPDADVEGAVYCPKCDVTRSARAAAQDQGEGNGR